MFDNLNTNIQPVTEQDILSVFGDEDQKKVKKPADNNKPSDKNPKEKKTTSSKGNTDLVKKDNTLTDFSNDDAEVFQNDDDSDEDDDDTSSTNKKIVKKDKEDDEDPEDDENVDPEEDTEEDNKNEGNEDDDPEEVDEEQSIKDFLKTRADFLIKKGEWVDFEGSEKVDWTEEEFAKIELDQRNYQKQLMYDEVLEGFGPIGREIATYTANGGDPDKLIDIFKEQQRVENLSVDTEDSQKAVVLKHQTEFLGQKPERAKKYIDSLIADKDLEAAAKEAKEDMESSLADQSERLQAQQEAKQNAQKAKQKADIQQFSTNVTKLINDDKNIPSDEKQQLIKVLTKYDKRLPNGTPVNEFYQRFAEFRKDLPSYLKLVRLVMNPDKFEKALKTEGNNQATDKAFKLVRTANKSKKLKSKGLADNGGKVGKTKFQLL